MTTTVRTVLAVLLVAGMALWLWFGTVVPRDKCEARGGTPITESAFRTICIEK